MIMKLLPTPVHGFEGRAYQATDGGPRRILDIVTRLRSSCDHCTLTTRWRCAFLYRNPRLTTRFVLPFQGPHLHLDSPEPPSSRPRRFRRGDIMNT
jgi:hypothetical protein